MNILVAITLLLSLISLSLRGVSAADCGYRKPGCNWLMVHDPVCGKNGCNYGNSGQASCGGTSVAYKGNCRK